MSMAPGSVWALLERNRPPIKRRTPHVKARTGCTTCKNRRVKCDERKPHCARCEKSGNQCAGYEDPNDRRKDTVVVPALPCKRAAAATAPSILRPRPLQMRRMREAEARPIDLMLASFTPSYMEKAHVPYFDRFRYQILGDISVWCGSDYWKHHVLGEFMHDRCLQYAAVAMAAMLEAVEHTPETMGGPLAMSRHRKAALYSYTKAISLMRERLLEGLTARSAHLCLTVTFMFAGIEILQGNVGEADQILASGLMILDDALGKRGSDGRPVLEMDGQLSQVKLAFDRMNIAWGLCPFFQGHKDVYTTMTPVQQFELPSTETPLVSKQGFWNSFQKDVGLFMLNVRCGVVVGEDQMPDVLAQRAKYLAQLSQWLPLLEQTLEMEGSSAKSGVLWTMMAYSLTAKIFMRCFLDRSDLSYDRHLDDFKEIVRICQNFVPEKQHSHLRFTLDIDLFPIISFTVTKCRDHKTRQLALKVFAETTYRQAFWNNQGLFKALRTLVDLEHKGRDSDGFIPPSSRYYFVGSEWDFERRQMMALFVCVTSVPTENGDMPTIRVPISF
ncbi:Uu.00g087400.m01.CDS01 [Anthostomella pinea]|uniref:Uu.00g087400.m01.CDS01 n=1 Tax=Anthostomella pinea TaxID=933095 RepID=A0AAI8VMB6_9PEZI|nr:Uu.00g087400.m01.CDS01 [Anthostomella pinea]